MKTFPFTTQAFTPILLCLGLASAALADTPAHLPAAILKYVESASATKTMVVDVDRLDTTGHVMETVHMVLRDRNKVFLQSHKNGKLAMTFSSDGQQMSWWDDKHYLMHAAPKTLGRLDRETVEGVNISMPLSVTAYMALHLFSDPESLIRLKGLTDISSSDKALTQQVTSFDGECRRNLAFSTQTGLPVKMTSEDEGVVLAFVFRYPRNTVTPKGARTLQAAIPEALFTTVPSGGLTPYAESLPALTSQISPLATGVPAPALILTAINGKTVSLADFKGRPVLLSFTSTWSDPDQKSVEPIEKVRKDLGAKGLVILSIYSMDENQTQEQLDTEAKAHPGNTGGMLIDSGPKKTMAADLYHVSSRPAMYLIDRNGNIAANFVGYSSDLEQDIRDSLKAIGLE